jgi:hypothetical protein
MLKLNRINPDAIIQGIQNIHAAEITSTKRELV